jgi:hypothetical protein
MNLTDNQMVCNCCSIRLIIDKLSISATIFGGARGGVTAAHFEKIVRYFQFYEEPMRLKIRFIRT